jgi:hypothetical protein
MMQGELKPHHDGDETQHMSMLKDSFMWVIVEQEESTTEEDDDQPTKKISIVESLLE